MPLIFLPEMQKRFPYLSSSDLDNFYKHETAIIDEGAVIGSDSRIWHWVHICSKARIGKNCSLGQNVFVSGDVEIGDNVKIQNGVSVYDKVVIRDNVFCGPSMVFTNVMNPRAEINRKDEYKSTLVKEGATLGANCTIVCGVSIGRSAFVGAGTLVNKDVPDFALIVGVPGKHIGWMSERGERLDLPLQGEGECLCPHTGDRYSLKGNRVFIQKNHQ